MANDEKICVMLKVEPEELEAVKAATFERKAATAYVQAARRFLAGAAGTAAAPQAGLNRTAEHGDES